MTLPPDPWCCWVLPACSVAPQPPIRVNLQRPNKDRALIHIIVRGILVNRILPPTMHTEGSVSSGSSGRVRGGARNMKSMQPPLVAIFYDLFSKGRGKGHGPLGPTWIRYWVSADVLLTILNQTSFTKQTDNVFSFLYSFVGNMFNVSLYIL